jgi:2,3-bisphosphoglycerate-independent phosphoglycerate mutase
MSNSRVLLAILDGWGIGQDVTSDAISQANTPFMDNLLAKYPHNELVTYGEEVGLPEGQMGNSEVGHLNIGAGRVVYQELARINKEVREGTLAQNATLLEAIEYAVSNKKPFHLMGLVSDGGVHSHINHLKALVDILENAGVAEIFIHAFTDGRDCDPKSGLGFIANLSDFLKGKRSKLASVIGRYFAMDRDKRWERVKLAYDLLVSGKGTKSNDLVASISESYQAGETDEFIKPLFAAKPDGSPTATIQDGDVVLCFNFRTDRPREITQVLTQQDFLEFGMTKKDLYYVTMTQYDESYQGVFVLFQNDNLNNTLGEIVSRAGKSQIRIAETEKYPHVTFFFSGGRESVFPGEERLMVSSPKVPTYDSAPEMSAKGITELITEAIRTKKPDFICLNYANADMVGHTGDFQAAIKAVETVDTCLSDLVKTALENNYHIIVIADHGNSDYMINPDGTPNTAHTMNPVPIIYVAENASESKVFHGKLGDIAPTILHLLEIDLPVEMTGNNLISKK